MKRLWSSAVLLAAAVNVVADDPFAGLEPTAAPPAEEAMAPWWTENLLFRRELYGMMVAGEDDVEETDDVYTRISAGFEVQKRFATATKTVASVNYQGRAVYRNHVLDTAADPMGMDAEGWKYETHNAYAEFYNLLGEPGRFNLRAGRFYIPFGLNYGTDTHGTLLQLSNDRVFGADRDWQVTAYGNATKHLDYSAGYVLGSGSDQKLDGQAGLAVGRLGLGNSMLFERGLEGGLSAAYGERIDPHASEEAVIGTWRAGADIRRRFDTGLGPFTLTGEGAVGEDESDAVWSGLAQADWLHPGRRWGVAAQYFRFDREHGMESHGAETDERASLVMTRYFRNDVGNAALHWIALGVEEQLQMPEGGEDALLTLQYYRYW